MSVDVPKAEHTIEQPGGEPMCLAETERHAAIGLRQTYRRTSGVGRINRHQLDRTGISCPSPPSRVTIATGRKGTTFDYFGERYRRRFASAGVELHIRGTAGALENFQLLRDRNSNVQIAFLTGGISNKIQAPELRSMGLISNVPFWIFYSSSQSLGGLPELKGKRIAVGPEGRALDTPQNAFLRGPT